MLGVVATAGARHTDRTADGFADENDRCSLRSAMRFCAIVQGRVRLLTEDQRDAVLGAFAEYDLLIDGAAPRSQDNAWVSGEAMHLTASQVAVVAHLILRKPDFVPVTELFSWSPKADAENAEKAGRRLRPGPLRDYIHRQHKGSTRDAGALAFRAPPGARYCVLLDWPLAAAPALAPVKALVTEKLAGPARDPAPEAEPTAPDVRARHREPTQARCFIERYWRANDVLDDTIRVRVSVANDGSSTLVFLAAALKFRGRTVAEASVGRGIRNGIMVGGGASVRAEIDFKLDGVPGMDSISLYTDDEAELTARMARPLRVRE